MKKPSQSDRRRGRRPTIVNGAWTQGVGRGYANNGVWRSDIPKSVLASAEVRVVRYTHPDTGDSVSVPIEEMRRALNGARPRRTKAGVFNIDLTQRTVNRVPVRMVVVRGGRPGQEPGGTHSDDGKGADGLPPRSRHWSGGETRWHRQTVAAIADDPSLVGFEASDVKRTWKDSLYADDGTKLWHCLRTSKRPDVVFEMCDGSLRVVEVEPVKTLYEGIGQLGGDYMVNLRVDRAAGGQILDAEAILVTDEDMNAEACKLARSLSLRHVVVPDAEA